MRRSAETKTSCVMSSARPWSLTMPQHVGGDAALVALVELLEGAVVAAADGGDERGVVRILAAPAGPRSPTRRRHRSPTHRGSSCRTRAPSTAPGHGAANCSVHLAGSPELSCGSKPPWPASPTSIAHLDELLRPGAFDDYGPNGLQVPGADEVDAVVTGVSAHARAVRARGRAGGRARARPPRAVLGLPPAGADAGAGRARCGCCSSTTSRSPPTTCRSTPIPRSATTRCSPSALGLRARTSRSASTRAGDRRRGALRRTASRRASCSRACARSTGREPLVFDDGPERVRRIGIVSGAAAELPRRGDRRGPRRASSPASRAST